MEVNDQLEKKLYNFIQSRNNGVTDRDILTGVPDLNKNKELLIVYINKFSSESKITISELGNGKLLYKARLALTEKIASELKGAECEDIVVYQIIENAGNKGIWIRDIRNKSNLSQQHLTKIVKNLMNKKMIKSVQTVTAGKKKVYMLSNLEPDPSLTGGAWYSDTDFDSDFVDGVFQACYRYLKMRHDEAKINKKKHDPLSVITRSYASVSDVCHFINNSGLSTIHLSESDIEEILSALIYEGTVERKLVAEDDLMDGSLTTKKTYLYRATASLLPPSGFICTPCSVCPVFQNCGPLSKINPDSCKYLADWLE